MHVTPITTRIFREGEDLISFILARVRRFPEGAVLVVTSKIVALAERRTAVVKDGGTKMRLIRSESSLVVPTKYACLTVKDGMVMASAGIDESNADGKLILLPRDSYLVARRIRTALRKRFGTKQCGVLITDSRLMPLRAGVTGVALGYAGFKGIRDYRGTPDIFGRLFHMSRTDVADSLATAAVLEMGEGAEQRPLALITGATVDFVERVSRHELHIDVHEDLYGPLYARVRRKT
ncbi:MAG: coenzyme F420-0:L-glutamate ligase [Patescibacteria group bacterium]